MKLRDSKAIILFTVIHSLLMALFSCMINSCNNPALNIQFLFLSRTDNLKKKIQFKKACHMKPFTWSDINLIYTKMK